MPNIPPPMIARGVAVGGSQASSPSARDLLAPNAKPDAMVDEILALLGAERYESARRLAKAALARFPGHPRVARAWSIFDKTGKARAVPAKMEPKSRMEEFAWLSHPPESAHGKWVALLGSKVLAMSESLAELNEKVRSMDLPNAALVHYVE